MKTSIVLTSTTEHFLEGLKKSLPKAELICLEKNKEGKRLFPDGEIYAKLSKVGSLKRKRVIVLHSGAPKPNDGLVELEMILQILKDNKIKPEVFFTYFPYAQQDKVFQRGEANMAEALIKKLVAYYNVKKIYAVDPHFGKMGWLRKYPFIALSTTSLLIEKCRNDFGENVLFLSPDKGGKRRTGISGFQKTRMDSFTVQLVSTNISLDAEVIGVVDDILETGGTLCRFYDETEKAGSRHVVALIAHGPFEPGIQRIKGKFLRLYITNTVNIKEANVDITDLITGAIQES